MPDVRFNYAILPKTHGNNINITYLTEHSVEQAWIKRGFIGVWYNAAKL